MCLKTADIERIVAGLKKKESMLAVPLAIVCGRFCYSFSVEMDS
jgi:hypothetical protein